MNDEEVRELGRTLSALKGPRRGRPNSEDRWKDVGPLEKQLTICTCRYIDDCPDMFQCKTYKKNVQEAVDEATKV